MRKSILSAMLILLSITLFSCTEDDATIKPDNLQPTFVETSDWYNRTETNGGPNGYSYVKVRDTFWGTRIYCKNPGYSSCPLGMKSGGMGVAIDYGYSQICNGVLSGETNLTTGFTVKWTSTSSDTTTAEATVKVWVTGEQEPDDEEI